MKTKLISRHYYSWELMGVYLTQKLLIGRILNSRQTCVSWRGFCSRFLGHFRAISGPFPGHFWAIPGPFPGLFRVISGPFPGHLCICIYFLIFPGHFLPIAGPFPGHSYICFHKWPRNGPEKARKWPGNGPEMVQKWPGNGPEMARKWPRKRLQNPLFMTV